MIPLAPLEETPATNPLLDAALRLYHSATTPQQERDAYLLARALGLPASYGENDDAETTALDSILFMKIPNALRRAERRGIEIGRKERWLSRFWRWVRAA